MDSAADQQQTDSVAEAAEKKEPAAASAAESPSVDLAFAAWPHCVPHVPANHKHRSPEKAAHRRHTRNGRILMRFAAYSDCTKPAFHPKKSNDDPTIWCKR